MEAAACYVGECSDPKRLPPVLPNACVGAGQLAFAARRVLGAEEPQSTAEQLEREAGEH
jgi:hypothetical protein